MIAILQEALPQRRLLAFRIGYGCPPEFQLYFETFTTRSFHETVDEGSLELGIILTSFNPSGSKSGEVQ
jgi:hypothetical protein